MVRLYPPVWRARYGEEFQQLLVDDYAGGRSGARWWLNIARHGLLNRLADVDLAGELDGSERSLRRVPGLLGALLAVCLLGGAAMWSQLAVGWQWTAPASFKTQVGVEVMSAGLLGLCLTGATLLCARLTAIARRVRAGARLPRRPLAILVASAVVLVVGCGRVGLTWPGTGGHVWAGRALAPAWLARRIWALTLWISSFWAHPSQLAALRPIDFAWMVLAPALTALLWFSWRRLISACDSPSLPRGLILAATAATALCTSLLLVFGAAEWALAGSAGPSGLFAPGAIDVGLLVVIAAAALVSLQLARRIALGIAATRAG